MNVEIAENLAESASAVVEATTEQVIEAAAEAVENAEQRAEAAEEAANAIAESARNSELAHLVEGVREECLRKTDAVEAALAELKLQFLSLQSSLTELTSQLAQMRQTETVIIPSSTSTASESDQTILDQAAEALDDVTAASAVEDQRAPALVRRRRVL